MTKTERLELVKRVERLKLEADTVICDCGEPYKDSDLGGLINDLLDDLRINNDK